MSKNWCLWIAMLEKTPEHPLNSKQIKPVNLKGDQLQIFTGRTDAEALVFWSCDAHRRFIDAGKDWEQKEKRASEDEMAGPRHWCSEHEIVRERDALCAAVHGFTKSRTRLSEQQQSLKLVSPRFQESSGSKERKCKGQFIKSSKGKLMGWVKELVHVLGWLRSISTCRRTEAN